MYIQYHIRLINHKYYIVSYLFYWILLFFPLHNIHMILYFLFLMSVQKPLIYYVCYIDIHKPSIYHYILFLRSFFVLFPLMFSLYQYLKLLIVQKFYLLNQLFFLHQLFIFIVIRLIIFNFVFPHKVKYIVLLICWTFFVI